MLHTSKGQNPQIPTHATLRLPLRRSLPWAQPNGLRASANSGQALICSGQVLCWHKPHQFYLYQISHLSVKQNLWIMYWNVFFDIAEKNVTSAIKGGT